MSLTNRHLLLTDISLNILLSLYFYLFISFDVFFISFLRGSILPLQPEHCSLTFSCIMNFNLLNSPERINKEPKLQIFYQNSWFCKINSFITNNCDFWTKEFQLFKICHLTVIILCQMLQDVGISQQTFKNMILS